MLPLLSAIGVSIRDAVQWWCLPGSLKPSLGALIWPSLAK